VPDVHNLKRTNEGAGMTLEVLGKPSDASSSLSSDSKIATEDISSDDDKVTKKLNEVTMNMDEVTKKDNKVTKKPSKDITNTDNVIMADVEQLDEQHARNEEHAIDKSIESRLKHNDPPKYVPDFGEIKLEKAAKMMEKVKAFKRHPAHKALFDALSVSLIVDEDDMDMQDDQPSQKKRQRDDYDKTLLLVLIKIQRRDKRNMILLRMIKTKLDLQSKESPRPPTPETPNPNWCKSQNTITKPEHDWFSTLEKSAKAPEDFDDVPGSTFDFSNFMKYRLKRNRLTKSNLESPVFKLFKGTLQK
nr:hypothetical protein [Tanacetum cinerariifolium]